MLKDYKIINETKVLDEFKNILEILKLSKYNIPYASFGYKNNINNKGVLVSIHDEWRKLVEKNSYYNSDPIFKNAAITKKNYVLYSRFNYNTFEEKKILTHRKNLELTKGFIKINHFKNFRIIYTLSTNYSKFIDEDFIRVHAGFINKIENYTLKIIKENSIIV